MQSILNEVKKALESKENLNNGAIELHQKSQKGEGMVAVITRIIYTGKDAQNETHKKDLVLKAAPTHEVYRSSMPIYEFYQNEISAYEDVLPTLRQVLTDFDEDFFVYPKCYVHSMDPNLEYLVLDDLKSCGYKMWNNKNIMDDDHILLVLNNLAKFHSASFYLKTNCDDQWKALINSSIEASQKFFRETEFCNAVIDLAKTLDNLFVDEQEILERFRNFRDNDLKHFMCSITSQNDPDFIMVHGDLWSNNILFKYDDNSDPNKPTKIAVLDYQHLRLSSLVLDLSYFLYICGTKDVMSRIDVYLSYYYDKLCQILNRMDLDPGVIFPESTFLNQWKLYNKFGFTMALVVLHGVSSDSDEFPSLEDVVKSGQNYWYALNFQSKHEKKYHEKIKDVILHVADRNYI